jgi:hypothetical protein
MVVHTMNFKETTDGLFDRMDHKDLADRLGVSVATIRQARLRAEAEAHRTPPPGWQHAVIRLAEERVAHFRKLIERMRSTNETATGKVTNDNRND